MYDRHKTVIKWYEYDATKLYRTEESEDVTGESMPYKEAAPAPEPVQTEQAPQEEAASMTGDPSLDDEVARIMAAFSGAKQNGVDDVFAAMAAQEALEGAQEASEDDQDALVASICAPKQNNVDDLVTMAREA